MKKKNKRIMLSVLGASIIFISGYKFRTSKTYFKLYLKKYGMSVSSDSTFGKLGVEDDECDFSLVKCGNYTTGLDEKAIELLEDTSVPTGIIIESSATNYAEIYKDVDYAKDIISNYSVEYPVCINVDSLMQVDSPDMGDITVMVKAFVEKMEANGCPTYVIGSWRSITSFLSSNKSYGGKTYKKGIIGDTYFPKNETVYDMVIGSKYTYINEDYTRYKNDEFNNDELFCEDWVYVATGGETLEYLSDKYNYSVNNIKISNNIENSKLYEGQEIVFPNVYHEQYYKGVDFSQIQGEVDFDVLAQKLKTKSNNGFAILRCGYTESLDYDNEPVMDEYFNHNLVNLTSRGIKVGVYYPTSARTIDEINQELKTLLLQIEGRDISLPVYIYIDGAALERLQSNDQDIKLGQINLIRRFINVVESAGYKPGIYINKNYIKLVSEFKDTCSIWTSGGYTYSSRLTFDNMIYPVQLEGLSDVYKLSQYGIGDYFGVENGEFISIDYCTNEFLNQKKYTKKAE